jgi:hypothetical protein
VLACSLVHCLWNEWPTAQNIVRVRRVHHRGITQHESIQSEVTLKVHPGLVSSHSQERLRLSITHTLSAVGVVKRCVLLYRCLNRLLTLKLNLHRILLLNRYNRSDYGISSSCRLSCPPIRASVLLTVSQSVKPPPIRVLNGKLGLREPLETLLRLHTRSNIWVMYRLWSG